MLNYIKITFLQEASPMKSIIVKGMSCHHCVMEVTKALSSIDGIINVKVDLESNIATYEETKPVDAQVVADAVKKAGYEVG
jgi:copper chaperone CopZ